MAALGALVAGVAGNFLGQKLGNSINNNNNTTTVTTPNVPAPVAETSTTVGDPALEAQAAQIRAQKRRTQATDISLFSLNSEASSKNSNNNSLLGL